MTDPYRTQAPKPRPATPRVPHVPRCDTCGEQIAGTDELCWAENCPMTISRRRIESLQSTFGMIVVLGIFGFFLWALIALGSHQMQQAADDCARSGGTFEPVYGGRGGYVCVPGARR